MDDGKDLSDAARRGLQRAAVHLMKAAIEVVEGLSAFLEELGKGGGREDDDGHPPQHIEVE